MTTQAERLAAGCVIGGMGLIALADNFIPAISERMGLWQFQVVRSGLVLPVFLAVVLLTGQLRALLPRSAWRMAVRSGLAIAALMLYLAALPAVSIAVAAAGFFTSPIWATVFSSILLGERVSPARVGAVLLGFAGVCVTLGLGAEPVSSMALLAILGGALLALSLIWTRLHCAGESGAAMAFWQFAGFLAVGLLGLAALPVLGPALDGVEGADFATRAWQPLDFTGIGLSAGVGIAGVVATGFIAVGYKSADPGFVGVFDFSFLLWAPLIGFLGWGEGVSAREALGMALIVAAGLVALRAGRARPAEEAVATPALVAA